MDLKFSFGGASPDHHHDGEGEAPSGIPLPFSVSPASSSSVLEIHVRRTEVGVAAEAVSGDGVTYGRAEVALAVRDPHALNRAVQSAVARVIAELAGPLADSVSSMTLDLGGTEPQLAAEFGWEAAPDAALAVTSEAFQHRTGLASGTPVHVA